MADSSLITIQSLSEHFDLFYSSYDLALLDAEFLFIVIIDSFPDGLIYAYIYGTGAALCNARDISGKP